MKEYVNCEVKFEEMLKEIEENFSGWDFSHISGRMEEFPLTWNYTNLIKRYYRNAESMLDMGTGGGEYLSAINKMMKLPKITCATEAYEPNIPIARERLKPLGVEVYAVKDDHNLPIEDGKFQLVVNRHEAFDSLEVKRILEDDGIFITQQVGGLNDKEINELLETEQSEFYEWNLDIAVSQVENAGFKIIDKREDVTKTRFYDIGAIVYYLKAIPWQVPDFSIEKYYDKLFKIHNTIEKKGYIDITLHRFLIICKK